MEDLWRGEVQDRLSQITHLQAENKKLLENLSLKESSTTEEDLQQQEGGLFVTPSVNPRSASGVWRVVGRFMELEPNFIVDTNLIWTKFLRMLTCDPGMHLIQICVVAMTHLLHVYPMSSIYPMSVCWKRKKEAVRRGSQELVKQTIFKAN